MHVAIFHHHLNRGGVTQVIVNHLRAMDAVIGDEGLDVFLFYGGRKSAWPDDLPSMLHKVRLHEVVVAQLDYDEVRQQQPQPVTKPVHLTQCLLENLTANGLNADNCVLHFHNHGLGRNRQLTLQTIGQLKIAGYRMLLQIHDFAEDFRPQNYRKLIERASDVTASLADTLYPAASQVLFGVINRRDAEYLARLGVDSDRIKYLPNPVAEITGITDEDTAKQKVAECCQAGFRPPFDPDLPFLVYPVRGIRRKNIGEAILMTRIAESPVQVGLTLPPLNPEESVAYEMWKSLVREFRLPVFLELGQVNGLAFTDIMSAADQILTTSVAEGFGMAFLEGLAIGKPLIGRNLPEITADFVQAGIEYPNLYCEFKVPIAAVNLADYRASLIQLLTDFYRDYEREFDDTIVDEILKHAVERGWIDFAKLTTELQFRVARIMIADPEMRADLRKLNPDCVEHLGSSSAADSSSDPRMEANRRCVKQSFSFASVGDRILSAYLQLMQTQPHSLPGLDETASLIPAFLDPAKTFPIRFENLALWSKQNLDRDTHSRLLIRENSNPLVPIPTGVAPRFQKLESIEVVLFDIYGTLLVSSSGDIGTDPLEEALNDQRNTKLNALLSELGLDQKSAQWKLRQEILKKHQSLRQDGLPHPEIDIVRVWENVIRTQLHPSDVSVSPASVWLGWPSSKVRELAIRYEIATNPVFPMPGMKTTLAAVRDAGLKLGIISNAQFYTPLTVEALQPVNPGRARLR